VEAVSEMKYYGITCKGCETRRNLTDSHLRNNGVSVEWIRGISGRHSGVTTVNPYTYHDADSTETISSGHTSLCINHWFAWERALNDGCDIAVVVEDDCRVVDCFVDRLGEAILYLDHNHKDWDFLYVGHWEGSSHKDFKGHCYDVVSGPVANLSSSPFGTHCYAIKSKAIPLLLDTCERIHAPIDVALWLNAGQLLRQYACVPPLAWQETEDENYQMSLSYSGHKDIFSNQ